MAKVATAIFNRYKLTPQTSLSQLSNYVEELTSKLSDGKTKEQAGRARDQARRCFRELGLSEEQAHTLIPKQAPGRRVVGRDTIKVIAKKIMENDLSPEEINEIAQDLVNTAPNVVAGASRLTYFRKELEILGADSSTLESTSLPHITKASQKEQDKRHELNEDKGMDCPEFFYLEKVWDKLNKCDITKPPSMQNLVDIIVMLSMRPADVATLHIDYYPPSYKKWYDPRFS
jgi:hypothetical protein